jgi:two-component system OmpR family response regulator
VRILIVEDEPLIGRALREALEAEGYVVDQADRGDTGLWQATENAYDAIILDIMLPGMNGYVVCRELREAGNRTPIMMLTAKDGEFDQAEGLDLGADDYMTKPFSLTVLQARLRAILRRGPSDRPAVLSAGDLVLDPGDRTCRRGAVAIELTPKEFSLLRYLLHRVGEPVSKRDLLEHVWSDDDADVNVVQVYVGYLRRKIDEPFGCRSIETVRGHGYRLVAASGTNTAKTSGAHIDG